MPRIISFAHTTPALVNGFKTVTRRSWRDHYARRFRAGDEVLAYDRSPRVGGQPVARLRLTADPVLEPWADAPDSDWDGEGFHYLWAPALEQHEHHGPSYILPSAARAMWSEYLRPGPPVWVIRFELLELLPGAQSYMDPRRPEDIPLARLGRAA